MIDLSSFLFENRYNTYNFGLFKILILGFL